MHDSTNTEKVLFLIALIAVAICVVMGMRMSSIKDVAVIERERIRVSQEKIKIYEGKVADLECRIHSLQAERDSIQILKNEIKIKTIYKVDSIRALPFAGKSEFFTEQVASLDTIRERYAYRDN